MSVPKNRPSCRRSHPRFSGRYLLPLGAILALAALLAWPSADGLSAPGQSVDSLSWFEQQTIAEINRLRSDPRSYATVLESRRSSYRGNILLVNYSGTFFEQATKEGPPALEEAIRAVISAPPARPLVISQALCRSARDHADDEAPLDRVSHVGTDQSGPFERIMRYSRFSGSIGEVISLGHQAPQDMVEGLLVDDGVSDRGHRKVLLNPDYERAGVACGAQRRYRIMCVIDFAEESSE